MISFVPRARLQTESGFTLVELVVSVVVLGFLMTGLGNLFVSNQRASTDSQARMSSQQNVRVAFGRLEFDARCASSGAIQSSGQGIYLVLPGTCSHSTGDVTWCVNSGSLVRISGTSCATAGITMVGNVTSATPFSCSSALSGVTGSTPVLAVALTVNTTSTTADQTAATDYIAMHNAAAGGCS
jgi:prepilin-type N-terminal cleavage/methylation domain-containing protein